MDNKEIIVYPEELLVGNFTSKRVGAQLWEEHYGIMVASIIHQINRQTPVSFQISLKDKMAFYFKIFPFWVKHSLFSKMNAGLRPLIKTLALGSDLSAGFNNNLAAIVHFVVNHEKILELGTTGIIKEIEAKKKDASGDKQDFYEGTLISLCRSLC